MKSFRFRFIARQSGKLCGSSPIQPLIWGVSPPQLRFFSVTPHSFNDRSTILDSEVFGNVFNTSACSKIWSDRTRTSYYLEFEAALAKVQARLNIIPKNAAKEIVKACRWEEIDKEQLQKKTELIGYPVLPVVQQLVKKVNSVENRLGEWAHWGATTQDLTDTATVLQLRDTLELVDLKVSAIVSALKELCQKYKVTPMAARSNLQQAVPISFGFKMARLLATFERHQERLRELRPRLLVLQFSGAAGTLATISSASSYGPAPPPTSSSEDKPLGLRCQSMLADELGLSVPPIAWHTERDSVAELGNMFAILTATCAKFATDLKLMMQTEVDEAREPYVAHRGSSSTMPQKRNPIGCAYICSMASSVRAMAGGLLEAVVTDHERSTGPWEIEWVMLPQVCCLTHACLTHTANILDGLEVDEEGMKRNLELTKGNIVSEAVMMGLGKVLGRQHAHDLVYELCRRSILEAKPLVDLLLESKEVKGAGLGNEELRSLCEPANYLGLSAEMVDRVLKRNWKILDQRFIREKHVTSAPPKCPSSVNISLSHKAPKAPSVMEFDTKTHGKSYLLDSIVAPCSTADPNSFAHVSARDRWPTGAIDDVHKATYSAESKEAEEEGKQIVEGLAKLKYELQHDRQMTPLPEDGFEDIAGYNKELEQRGPPKWLDVSWLYSECYLYRRMSTLFKLSKHWKEYDVFSKQKMSTFKSSRPAVLELAARYKDLITQLNTKHEATESKSKEELETAERVLFTEMCEICLWGNATDLSLLTNLSYEDIQNLQGSKARKAQEANIVANDFPAAFEILRKAREQAGPDKERRVDIVLDNAGFELFVDLILAGYLLSANLATCVILHPKSIPWFVSDVLPKDFSDLLNAMADPKAFYETPSEDEKHKEVTPQPLSDKESEEIEFLFKHWSELHADGKLVIRPNRFWTQAGSYWRMPKTAPALFEDLKESELVIHKGDLNYRKLTGDAMWDPTTPFTEAIGPFGPKSGVRTLALRTCKADVVVGLPKGEDERLKDTEGGGGDSGARKWAWSGKWAVVQLCDGKA
ncbi:MAG: hypothetical protein M1820_009102 [Bogoriella megaspora]|nr:MAG: hypothetical protein M1820_009102 [Bogoriella megaspora]